MVITPDVAAWKRFAVSRLTKWERVGLVLLGILAVAFAGIVELRGAFLNTRKTDYGVYARTAYAVRTGADIYEAVDDNGYHYTYPPPFAVLMVPLADAPAGAPRTGMLPFPVGVALWTALNYLLIGRIVHVLASLILPNEVRGSRRWWYARTVPVYVTLGAIGWNISIGQVNLLVVAMICEMLRTNLSGRRLQSGVWLAAAIALKLIPAYLLLFPLMRRDRRAGAGVLLGLALFLGAVPLAGLGFDGTVRAYTTFANRILFPGAIGPADNEGLKELLRFHGNDSYSFVSVIHCNIHSNPATMMPFASKETRMGHLALAALVTLITAAFLWRWSRASTINTVLSAGLLLQMMIHVNPMSHMHYFTFGLPVVAALWLRAMSADTSRVFPSWKAMWPVAVWGVGMTMPILPGETFATLRHHGFMLGVSMVVWGAGLRAMMPVRKEAAVTLPFEVAPVITRQAA